MASRPTITIRYACQACRETSEAAVADLETAEKRLSVAERRELAEARAKGTARDREESALHALAEMELPFATCVRCGKRNPAGVGSQRRTAISTLVISALVAGGAFVQPWALIAYPIMGLLGGVLVIIANRLRGAPVLRYFLVQGVIQAVVVVVLLRAQHLAFTCAIALGILSMLMQPWETRKRFATASSILRFYRAAGS